MPEKSPSPRPPSPREIAGIVAILIWVVAVLTIDRSPPLAPPAVPYGKSPVRIGTETAALR
ncbi:hypothetical protein MMB17_15385 [Methylobacterium organophilum]|uniref:hypothetical protein n=1 Tax=Methylobacterium organophilum TaxID=410 RepID=UPI001F13195E|nr:hypothetical protein [Methylobacterium organophilum]UMY16100.1 hypothetical protein MMB17_15385 [Methylobacterium organophilum]